MLNMFYVIFIIDVVYNLVVKLLVIGMDEIVMLVLINFGQVVDRFDKVVLGGELL